MKSKKKQRILALILSMVLMLSASISALAEGDVQTEASGTETTENQAAVQSLEQETVPETEVTTEEGGIDTQSAETSTEPVQENTEQEVTETPAEPEQGVTEETAETTDTTQSQAQSTEVQEESDAAEEIPVEEQPGETTEETVTEETVVSEAAELKQEFTDENGNVTQTVTAYVPEGAFQATADQISMEVSLLNTDDTNYIKGMMEELLPENHYLDGYVLYQIDFKVNGEITQPAKAVTITMNGNDLAVEDTQKAHVFYYDAADPEVEGDKDQLIEVTQKDQLLKSLEESGESTENIEDYDYSEIAVNEGNADTITVKGWESTIYGCYVEKEAVTELTYEDDSVTVTVSADQAGIIPDGAELSVTPITKTEITDDMSEEEKAQAEEVNAQYEFTEEKLKEDSEENDTTMEGFLAYDICFLVDGKEVEPSGDVRVVMDFKEAAVPEGVSEAAEVTVKHLKADESAEDGVVVEDMAEKASVQTTEKAEVQKVELSSDSFSTFTITWTTSGYSITVHYVNEKYQEITSDNVQSENIEITDTSETVITNYNRTITGYIYNSATIGKPDEASGSTVPSIYSVRVNSSGALQYRTTSDGSWSDWNSNLGYHVYLVYSTRQESAVIETVDNTEENITLHLFDYSTGNSEYSIWEQNPSQNNNYNRGINAGKILKFLSDASGTKYPYLDNINKWTGDSSVHSGIVRDGLVNGFPVLNRRGGGSLDYLFSTNDYSGKTVYQNANHLFTKDADGYLIFDSDSNYAQFDPTSKNFTVYSNPYSDREVGNNKGLKVFYPFDDFDSIADTYLGSGGTSYGENGNGGWGLGSNSANHYFGMTMSATFYQPEGGRINGNDMVFEFSGDDDVWVFIDNQLVLDLGGIHDRASGSINFASGDVYINDAYELNMYKNIFDEKFDDYSTHTINFFYLERGNNASNCKLTFNLPTIPEDSVMVTKQVTGESGTTLDYAQDIDFQFVITQNGKAVANTEFEIRNANNQVVGTGKTDDDGNFTLKHGQSAIFEGFLATDNYEVKEIGASLNEGYEVTIDGVDVVLNNGDGSAEQILQSASTGSQQVSDLSSAVFRNKISNTATLSINKIIKAGSEDTLKDKSFNIRVWINDELYTGTYSVNNESSTATNGVITLNGGQTATISGLPYGARFEIEEILDGSCRPVYTVGAENTYNAIVPEVDEEGNIISDVTSASANISGNASVTVTNQKINTDNGTTKLTVTKTWEKGTDDIKPEGIYVTLYQDNNNNGIKDEGDTEATGVTAKVTLNDENSWTHTWENLPADTNFVVEESEITSGDLDDFTSEVTLSSSFDFEYLDRVTTCSNLTYLLGQNNMLLVKLTSNSGYILWTPVDLGLTGTDVQKIAASIREMKLPGAGNLELTNLKYTYGTTDSTLTNGLTLTKSDNGWTLNFEATSAWAQFWNLQYDRTISTGIINRLNNTIDIPVEKQWYGDENHWKNQESITIQLYKNEAEEGTPVEITKGMGWHYTFTDMDKYYWDDNSEKYVLNEYTVVETHVGDNTVEDAGVVVDISGDSENGFLIKNIYPQDWAIAKVSTTDNELYLGGAQFTLTKEGDSTASYYGETYADNYLPKDYDEYYTMDGEVYWWKNETDRGYISKAEEYIEDGTYILQETKAPDGYLKSNITWTIKIENLQIVSIIDSNGTTITPYAPEVETRAVGFRSFYLFENTPYYELPSAGGPGIFLYMIGGTLLMIAGSLMIYINRRRGVLR